MGTVIHFGSLQGTTGFLAPQELRATLAICSGMSGKQAARELGCAPGTVKKTIERIFFKLSVSNRASLVAKAFALGLIQFTSTATPDPKHQQHQDQHHGVLIA